MQIIRWPVPEELRTTMAITCRNGFAEAISSGPVEEIVGRYAYLSVAGMERMLRLAEAHILDRPLHGAGIELGAGCGLLSALAARQDPVRSIFAVEICERMVELIIPKVAEHVLGSRASKVQPVVGSFDDLQVPDNSLDFAIEYDSLHHADDLAATLTECARVLKSSGILLCFDRCHPDSLSDEEVERMLSKVYSPEFLSANCYPSGIVLTRRENGEHEYRLREWQAAFEAAGLKLVRKCDFVQRITFARAVKGVLSQLPSVIRRRVYSTDNASLATTATWLAQQLRSVVPTKSANTLLAPKSTSVMLVAKR